MLSVHYNLELPHSVADLCRQLQCAAAAGAENVSNPSSYQPCRTLRDVRTWLNPWSHMPESACTTVVSVEKGTHNRSRPRRSKKPTLCFAACLTATCWLRCCGCHDHVFEPARSASHVAQQQQVLSCAATTHSVHNSQCRDSEGVPTAGALSWLHCGSSAACRAGLEGGPSQNAGLCRAGSWDKHVRRTAAAAACVLGIRVTAAAAATPRLPGGSSAACHAGGRACPARTLWPWASPGTRPSGQAEAPGCSRPRSA